VQQDLKEFAYSTPATRELVSQAENGDELAVYELQGLPDCPDIWIGAGDLDRKTRKAWLDLLAGNDLTRREALKRELADKRAKFAGAEPTFLERLLVDRILSCWLAVQYAEARYVRSQTESSAEEKSDSKRFRSANRHLQASIKQLVLMRKLLPDYHLGSSRVPDPLTLIGLQGRRERAGGVICTDRSDDEPGVEEVA
jgi:hypothetical protein